MRFYVKESRFEVDSLKSVGEVEISAKIKTAKKKCGNFKNHPLVSVRHTNWPLTLNLSLSSHFQVFCNKPRYDQPRNNKPYFTRLFTICSEFYRAFYSGNDLSDISQIKHYLISEIKLVEPTALETIRGNRLLSESDFCRSFNL